MKRRLFLLSLLAAAGVALAADIPAPVIGAIGDEEVVDNLYMEHPSVATDSKGQPHLVCDNGGNTQFMKYHRVNDQWSGGIFAVGARGGRYDASRLYIGQIEIDSRDRAWISCKFGVKEYGAMYGQGIWLFKNVSTTATPAEQFFRFVCVYKGMGVVTTDAKYPDQGVVIGTFGNYAILYSSGQTLSTGSLNGGPGGEKVRARIASYAPRFGAAPGGNYPDGIWHTAMNGYSAASSRYQNSARYKSGLGPVEWAAYGAYPQQGSDFSHPGIGIDLVNPQICYIASVFNNCLCINIWDGARLLYSSSNLKVLDYNATYEARHGPAFAPAPSGGTFVFWTSGGRIKAAFLSPAGTASETIDIAAGRSPAATTDRFGNLHLAYSSGGARYRKIILSSLDPLAPAGRLVDTRSPAFSWSDTLAPSYTLALSRDGALLETATVPTNSWTPASNLEAGVYSWIVKEGEADSDKPWSRPLAFTIPPLMPEPEAPAGRLLASEAVDAAFSWSNADDRVTRFKVELFKDADSLGVRLASDPALAWPGPLAPGAYSWRVKALRVLAGYPVSSEWSPVQRFQVEVPGACAILTPASLETFPPGALTLSASWTPAEGASSYRLTLLYNGSPLDSVFVKETMHDFSLAAQPGYLTLLVQPKNAAGKGETSPARTFIVNRAMTPSNGVTLAAAPAGFRWTRSTAATKYLFKLSRYDESAKRFVVVVQSWPGQAKHAPAYSFTPGAYRWTITDYAGTAPGFTSSAYFIVLDPE